MKFTLTFDMNNAAFCETLDDAREEGARVLRAVQKRFADFGLAPGCRIPIYDANGNKIGFWKVEASK